MKTDSNRRSAGLKFGDLRLAWLTTFVTVARLENRSDAGRELGMSQGAVTKHLHSLERWHRTLLVMPDSVPAKLTKPGEAFVEVAERILQIADAARTPLAPPSEPRPKISPATLRVPPSVGR